jgi:hypothetical protein
VYSRLFQHLDYELTQLRSWWQFQPFHYTESRWQHDAPELHAALHYLDEKDLSELQKDPAARAAFLARWIPSAGALLEFCRLPPVSIPTGNTQANSNPRWASGIPGRKWQQIKAFCRYVPEQTAILEWCAGKGHLGRTLARAGATSVTSLEWHPDLCKSGTAMAKHAQLQNQRFVHQDVLSEQAADYLTPQQHAIALHACGDLHIELLLRLGEKYAAGLTLSPCCYHLTKTRHYQPLSRQGKLSTLLLDKADLQMPLQETVTAGARQQRQRRQELLWRLSFDCLQRELRQTDCYLPLPTIPRRLLKEDFFAFIHWATEQKHLILPSTIDCEYYLAKGQERIRSVEQMELVQFLFQRPLEIWLALDKVLFLQQSGYSVSLTEFCEKKVTPRNLLIIAHKNHP